MQAMPSAVPITKIKSDPTEVLGLIEKGPVMLTTRGTGVAVIASLGEWNDMVKQLSEKRFTEAHMKALALAYQYEREGYETETMEDLKARIAEHDRVAGKA